MSLKDKLKKIKELEQDSVVDWVKRKQEWLTVVENFYSQVKTWLKEYEKDGYLKVQTVSKQLTEDHLGSYATQVMKILIGDKTLIFEPIGTLIIGAYGRIDFYMSGHQAEKKMLLLSKDTGGNAQWLLVDSKNKREGKRFDAATLESIIDSWI